VVFVKVNGYTIEPWAILSWANLAGANLDRVDLSEARTDGHTTWPEGFDPIAAGVV
jgi:uncharacterized protein YjbI with pentapeptide repeats